MEYLEGIQPEFGSEISLNEMTEISRLAGNPEKKLKIIHIAGTNGKGSVGNYICNILAMSGYTVGRYVSPTLFDYRERIQRITGNMYGIYKEYITEEEVAESITQLKAFVEIMNNNGFKTPSPFEIETVMAFQVMCRWNVDIAVIEVGMGGTNDATNIIEKPVVSVITSVDMDHMQFLGDNLLDIARNKYGIIKNGVPVVALIEDEKCREEIKTVCHKKHSPLHLVDKDYIRPYEFSMKRTSFIYYGEKYDIGQAGVYQLDNAAVALSTIKVLYENGFRILNMKSVKAGLLESKWRGRFDLVSNNPYVIADGAHNPAATKFLKYSLNAYFPGEKFNYIIGVFADKDYEEMLKIMLPHAASVYTITAPGGRGLDKDILAECVRKISKGKIREVQGKNSVKSALSSLISCKHCGKIVVFGSLSFIHEVYEYFSDGH